MKEMCDGKNVTYWEEVSGIRRNVTLTIEKNKLCAYVRTCVRAYVRTCVRAYVRTCVRAYVRTCVYATPYTDGYF